MYLVFLFSFWPPGSTKSNAWSNYSNCNGHYDLNKTFLLPPREHFISNLYFLGAELFEQ